MYTTSGIQAGDQGENARAALWFANAARLLAGQRLHEGGGAVNLSAAEWLERWRAFARRGDGGGKSD
jgi:hypothetical protein